MFERISIIQMTIYESEEYPAGASISLTRVILLRLLAAGAQVFNEIIDFLSFEHASERGHHLAAVDNLFADRCLASGFPHGGEIGDRKSTRLNSSHLGISY